MSRSVRERFPPSSDDGLNPVTRASTGSTPAVPSTPVSHGADSRGGAASFGIFVSSLRSRIASADIPELSTKSRPPIHPTATLFAQMRKHLDVIHQDSIRAYHGGVRARKRFSPFGLLAASASPGKGVSM